jgi:hypothetical protein
MNKLKRALSAAVAVAALAALVGCTSGKGLNHRPFVATQSATPTPTSPSPSATPSAPSPSMTPSP